MNFDCYYVHCFLCLHCFFCVHCIKFLLQKEDQLLLKEIGLQGEGDPSILQQLIDDVSLLRNFKIHATSFS